MFQYQDKVNAGVPQVCTPEIWDQLIDSPEVKSICDQIAALDPQTPDYNDRKQALKRRLPIIIPHAASFRNGKRVSADAIPSGLAMLDVDHVSNPRDWFESIDKQLLSDNRIYLVAITASGQGLRLIGERLERESIEAAQLRMATALNITEYDAVTKDLARASYVVPRDYILWIYEAGLFSEEERLDLMQQLALPPHQEVSSVASESDSDIEKLSYRGIPYENIVQQLLIATGNGDGAVLGERNTVYFSLANYMRYILSDILLLKYGWPSAEAGLRYPEDEKSFRGTLNARNFTDRGFKVHVNDKERRVEIIFDNEHTDERHKLWEQSVLKRVGHLNNFDIVPYWGFDDLFHKAGVKLTNCFYVQADEKWEGKVRRRKNYFLYNYVLKLSQFDQEKFIEAIRAGKVYVDFDARTGHNHGTKFRIRYTQWVRLDF